MDNEILPLGTLLKKEGKITDEQLNIALEEQKKTGERLGHTLIKLGFISEEDLVKALEKQFNLPCITINPKMINPQFIKIIPEDICRKYRLIPFMLVNNRLVIAVTDPYNLDFINEIKFTTDYDVELALCSEKSIMDAINFFFGEKEFGLSYRENISTQLPKGVSAVKLLDLILIQAQNMNASEVHLQYFENEFNILFITKGEKIKTSNMPAEYYKFISTRIKLLAKLDVSGKMKFQEGIANVSIYGKNNLIRVFIFPHLKGENIIIKFS